MAIPLLWPTIPPLTDLPAHMGRYEVQLSLATSPALQSFYGFEWRLIGNLGVDLLVMPLAPLLGLEPAVKLIVMAIPVLTAVGMLLVAREVHGSMPPTALFALPLAYSQPFQFGFVNYMLAMALALLALALWLQLARTGRFALRAVLFVPLGVVLWLCHTVGWAAFGVIAFAVEVTRCREQNGDWGRAVGAAIITCLPLAVPLILIIATRSDGSGAMTADWFNWSAKITAIKTILRDRWEVFDVASLYLLFGVVCFAIINRGWSLSRPMIAAAALLGFVTLLLPSFVFGSNFVDMRLAPFVLALALLAIGPAALATRRQLVVLTCLALLFLGVRLAATTDSFMRYHDRHSIALAALDHVPRGARLASFVVRGCDLTWATHRMEHLPGMAIVRRHAFSNDQFDTAGAQLLTVRKRDGAGIVADDSQIVTVTPCGPDAWPTLAARLTSLPRAAFDYVWLIDAPVGAAPIPADFTLVWSNGRDHVYRVGLGG